MAEKLIRDHIPELALGKGDVLKTRVADVSEMPELLLKKLIEEMMEFKAKPSYEELADVLEVVYALADYMRVQEVGGDMPLTTLSFIRIQLDGRDRLEGAREVKKMLRGAFRRRLVLLDGGSS